MLLYSEINGGPQATKEYHDEMGDYNGLDSPPPDGEDQVREPFSGANKDWEEYRRLQSRAVHKRKPRSDHTLRTTNYPWRTPEGDMEYTLKEMETICKEIHKGKHPFAAINQKETLRCINEASMMYRDTLRDSDEGDCCSLASNDAEPLPNDRSDIENLPAPENLVLFLANGRPDPQYVFPPWTMPDDLDDHEGNQVFYNVVTFNQITEHPLIYE